MANLTRRQFTPAPTPLTTLEFVAARKSGPVYWTPPPKGVSTHDAAQLGMQRACDLAQFLADNPEHMGQHLLAVVAASINNMPGSVPGTDTALGFWLAIETLLCASAVRLDHYGIVSAASSQGVAA